MADPIKRHHQHCGERCVNDWGVKPIRITLAVVCLLKLLQIALAVVFVETARNYLSGLSVVQGGLSAATLAPLLTASAVQDDTSNALGVQLLNRVTSGQSSTLSTDPGALLVLRCPDGYTCKYGGLSGRCGVRCAVLCCAFVCSLCVIRATRCGVLCCVVVCLIVCGVGCAFGSLCVRVQNGVLCCVCVVCGLLHAVDG